MKLSLGEVLKRYRNKECLSQNQMANKLDITRQTYNYLEKDKHSPSLKTIRVIAKVLNLEPQTIKDLLEKIDTKKKEA